MSMAIPTDQSHDAHTPGVPNSPPNSPPGAAVPGSLLQDPAVTQRERNGAMTMHLIALIVSMVVSPLIAIIPLAIFWSSRKSESVFVDDHGREAINALLSYMLWTLILLVTVVGPLILFVVAIVSIIRGAIAASNGEYFRYPITIRFIS